MQNPYPPVEDRTDIVSDGLSEESRPIPYVTGDGEEGEKGWTFSSASSPLKKDDIIASIEFLNANYEVLNVDKFGPVSEAKTVIVVQVHTRIEYLRYLITTLQKAKHIEDAFLIFSHDFSSAAINQLVKEIRFCRVMQIFYPYNIQLFPNVYPGQDPEDCEERMTKEEAEQVRCKNWKHPDKYGHYRVAKITQIKHHWWWKMNYVFDGIMKRYDLNNAWVLLLEEDHYVSPDFLHVLNWIVDHKKEICDQCHVITLGFYLKQYNNYEADIAKLGVHPWFSSKHNMGMAINRNTWRLIKNCSKLFCTYDDYNWDWSLMHLSAKCLPSKLRVITAKAPRVIHVGDCGVHTHRCAVHNAAEKARDLFLRVSKSLFPKFLNVSENSRRMLKPSKENGGWGDVRDHELCLNNTVMPIVSHTDVEVMHNLVGLNLTNVSHPFVLPL